MCFYFVCFNRQSLEGNNAVVITVFACAVFSVFVHPFILLSATLACKARCICFLVCSQFVTQTFVYNGWNE